MIEFDKSESIDKILTTKTFQRREEHDGYRSYSKDRLTKLEKSVNDFLKTINHSDIVSIKYTPYLEGDASKDWRYRNTVYMCVIVYYTEEKT